MSGLRSSGWKAQVEQDWSSMTDRLVLHRRSGDGWEVVVGFDEHGFPVLKRFQMGTVEQGVGLHLDPEMIQAIALVVKPGPTEAEMRRVTEALEIERARVDRVIGAAAAVRGEGAPTRKGGDGAAAGTTPSPPPTT